MNAINTITIDAANDTVIVRDGDTEKPGCAAAGIRNTFMGSAGWGDRSSSFPKT